MKSDTIWQFSLAISPEPHIIEQVGNLKHDLQKQLKKNYGSANSLAHISILTFRATDVDYLIILKEFQRILAGLAAFNIELSGFGNFSSTFYIRPENSSAQLLIACWKNIKNKFNKLIKRKYNLSWEGALKDKPHMSIARNLTMAEIQFCYTFFSTDFSNSFFCNSFVMRKLNPVKHQYEIIDTIPLRGDEYIEGEQMWIPGI